MRAGLTVLTVSLLFSAATLNAQRRMGGGPELRGIPASVTSPRTDGSLRGIPGSVTDPRAAGAFRSTIPFGHVHPVEPFHHRRPVAVVPYAYYGYPYYDYSAYEQSEPQPAQTVQPQVIIIKEESAHSDDGTRYGEHSFAGGDPAPEAVQSRPAPIAQPEDPGPMTTLVYRDGHKMELRNYAIVGPDLIDLTKSPVIKKIPLASLDLEATRRENEDNGVNFP